MLDECVDFCVATLHRWIISLCAVSGCMLRKSQILTFNKPIVSSLKHVLLAKYFTVNVPPPFSTLGPRLLILSIPCTSHLQIQDSKAIKPIVAALEDPVAGVRGAAASCVRGMTRSVKDLRADWIDESTTTPLVKLLTDPDTDVQVWILLGVLNEQSFSAGGSKVVKCQNVQVDPMIGMKP